MHERLELPSRHLEVEVDRLPAGGREELLAHPHLRVGGEADLRRLRHAAQPRHGARVLARVDRVDAFQLVEEEADEHLVEVVPTEVRVPRRRSHLAHAVEDLEDRHVERASAEVVDEDGLRAVGRTASARLLVDERGAGRLVQQAQHVHTRQLPGAEGRPALRVVEVGGHGDHDVADRIARRLLGPAPEHSQHLGRHFLGRDLARPGRYSRGETAPATSQRITRFQVGEAA